MKIDSHENLKRTRQHADLLHSTDMQLVSTHGMRTTKSICKAMIKILTVCVRACIFKQVCTIVALLLVSLIFAIQKSYNCWLIDKSY